MTQEMPTKLSRRDFAKIASFAALALGVPAAAIRFSKLDAGETVTNAQRHTLATVGQLTLPKTGTPGAGDVGTHDFVILAFAHGLDGTRKAISGGTPELAQFSRRDGSLRYLEWLDFELGRRVSGSFAGKPHDKQLDALTKLDAEAFREGNDNHPWRTIKALILTGYYTSEVGASQELQYELVPGRWDPDLSLAPHSRAYSSDWTAVDFG